MLKLRETKNSAEFLANIAGDTGDDTYSPFFLCSIGLLKAYIFDITIK
jgi:hypothetical protein